MTIQSRLPPTTLIYTYCPWIIIYDTPLHSQKCFSLENKLYCQPTYLAYQDQIPSKVAYVKAQTGFLNQEAWSRLEI